VHSAQSRGSRSQANDLSVRLELQADFFAGVWANQPRTRYPRAGDIEEALGAASAVGDDRLQRQAQGRVVPELIHSRDFPSKEFRCFAKASDTGTTSRGDTFTREL